MKKYKKYSKIETKNKKQVHKINKAEKKVDTENGNIFYLLHFRLCGGKNYGKPD
jgi:hypothetical protein